MPLPVAKALGHVKARNIHNNLRAQRLGALQNYSKAMKKHYIDDSQYIESHVLILPKDISVCLSKVLILTDLAFRFLDHVLLN